MKETLKINNFILNTFLNKTLISRSLLIIEKIISFLMTAFMASILSYKDIGFWSQVMFSTSLFTSLVSFNIPNGIIAIVPRIKNSEEKYEFIFKSALFILLTALIFSLLLLFFKDVTSNILFNNILTLNIFILILIIGLSELLLEFFLYSYRSIKDFSLANYILILRIMPRIVSFAGIYRNDINLIINLYATTFILSCITMMLFLYRRYSYKIIFLLRKNLNILLFFSPKPYLKSLLSLSRKSVLATLTASLFFFLLRSITISNMGLDGVGKLSLAISAGATLLSLTAFIGFTFYPYISNKAINEKNLAFKKTRELSLNLIYLAILIPLILIVLKLVFKSNLNFYPFTINSIDLFMALLGYGFLGAYQLSQPFAFALTDNINVVKIEILSSFFSLLLIFIVFLVDKFSIHFAILSFCVYALCNYLQANQRNFKILKDNID